MGMHYADVIMGAIASQITSLTIVYSTVYSGAEQRKHQSSASLAFVRGLHRGPVNSPHKWPVTRKMFPFDDVIMISTHRKEWDVITSSKIQTGEAHNSDGIMGAMASQIAGVSIVCSTVCSRRDQGKYQSSAWLGTGGFPSQRASNAENISIWWRYRETGEAFVPQSN